MPVPSCCRCPFYPLCIEVDLALTLYGVATTPKLIDCSYFFISSVISKSSSILFLFLFFFFSALLLSISFSIGLLELEIFSSLFSISNLVFSFSGGLLFYSLSKTFLSCGEVLISYSPSISSILHFAFLTSFAFTASCAASSRNYYR